MKFATTRIIEVSREELCKFLKNATGEHILAENIEYGSGHLAGIKIRFDEAGDFIPPPKCAERK